MHAQLSRSARSSHTDDDHHDGAAKKPRTGGRMVDKYASFRTKPMVRLPPMPAEGAEDKQRRKKASTNVGRWGFDIWNIELINFRMCFFFFASFILLSH